ncbi:hypothetical protein THIOM_002090 [Candidatus Thiomargarita nelsonii]|uniref:Uncharacterized protein n=1 Tax=Candidatus Thiomargarita nelsonii TaxID=1003181 RepID=A0A176S219_9GAMM|nr:hypothetical protein THIOM_002090 [Candidatus Thiomargarita nelsonii]
MLGSLPAFETEAVKTEGQRGIKHNKYALLDEDQTIFALTLSRNTPEVVQLKLELTTAFKNARTIRTGEDKMFEHARVNRELMEIFEIKGNMQTLALNRVMQNEFGVNLLENWGMKELRAAVQEQLLTITDIAKEIGMKPRKVNPLLVEMGLQTMHRDHKNRLYYEITDEGHDYAIYLDSGKRHSDGTPVRQVKWYAKVIELMKKEM